MFLTLPPPNPGIIELEMLKIEYNNFERGGGGMDIFFSAIVTEFFQQDV